VLPTNTSAEATMALAGSTAAPGEVSGTAVPARPGKKAATPRATPAPAAAPAPVATLAGGAIMPALPRASAQRVDPGALLFSAARTKYDSRLLDEARADLQTLLRDHPTSASAPGAWLLSARIDSQQGRPDDAIAGLLRLRSSYRDDSANAEGSVLLGQLLERSKRPDRVALAREVLGDVPQRFAESPWAPRALAQRALLETRERVKATDPSLGTVPAAFETNRLLIERYPASPEAESALWQVAAEYEDRKVYDRAVATLVDMTKRFPQTRYDAWWQLGELYDKRLKDAAAARGAYANVPPSSARYKDAQKRAERR